MLRLSFITIHPDFINAYLGFGPFKAALQKDLLAVDVINLREYATDSRGSVDDRAYGGGDGMILMAEPLTKATRAVKDDNSKVILLSPQGRTWDQGAVSEHQTATHLILICGRFGGVDQRYIDAHVDAEISVGDFIVSGGELAALLVADSLVRWLDGALGHSDSSVNDSFGPGMAGNLEYPQYTRPELFEGQRVPEILLSGNHQKIAAWQREQSVAVTRRKRPDLLNR